MATPTLRQLRTFLAVVETGQVSAAARLLGLTQPAASQQLRELERTLRVRLLDRAKGRVVPTAAGAALLDPARRADAAIAEVASVAASYRAGEAGRVRFGSGATACIHLLPAVLAQARRAMPGLDLVVATGNTSEIVRRIATGALDVGLVTLPLPPDRALSVEPLLEDELVALLPGHAPGGALSPAAIAEQPLILYEPGGSTRLLIDLWFRAAGLAVAPIMQLDSVESIKVLVAGGLGASVLPALALADGVPGATVRALDPPLSRQLGVVVRRDKVVDRGLRVVLAALAATGRSLSG